MSLTFTNWIHPSPVSISITHSKRRPSEQIAFVAHVRHIVALPEFTSHSVAVLKSTWFIAPAMTCKQNQEMMVSGLTTLFSALLKSSTKFSKFYFEQLLRKRRHGCLYLFVPGQTREIFLEPLFPMFPYMFFYILAR